MTAEMAFAGLAARLVYEQTQKALILRDAAINAFDGEAYELAQSEFSRWTDVWFACSIERGVLPDTTWCNA